MSITELSDGRWFADVEPIKGKRSRKWLKTKMEVQQFETTARQKCIENPSWTLKPKNRRCLSELAEPWYELHGQTLSNGYRYVAILWLVAKGLGDPVAVSLESAKVVRSRSRQIANGMSGKTANDRPGYLKSMYNELRQFGVIDHENPIGHIRPLRLQERPLSYLTKHQVSELFTALDACTTPPHPKMAARIYLATGARWGEAQALTSERLRGNTVIFTNTKSKRVRLAPISEQLVANIRRHWQIHGPFTNCLDMFRLVLLSTSTKLPKGQASYILCHTFASRPIMSGGHIVTLQHTLGHASLSTVMRYAHLSQDHLSKAVRFNPSLASF